MFAKRTKIASFPGLIDRGVQAINQDFIGGITTGSADYFWVIDGATPCCGDEEQLLKFIDWLDNGFKSAVVENGDPHLPTVVGIGVYYAREKLIEHYPDIDRLPDYRLPSVSFTMLKVSPYDVELAGIGDSGVYGMVTSDGFSVELKYERDEMLRGIDRKLIELLKLLLETRNYDVKLAREDLKIFIKEYRKEYQNKPDGYGVLTPKPESMSRIKFSRFESSEKVGGRAVLYSDGLDILFTSGIIRDERHLLDVVGSLEPEELYELAVNIAVNDPKLMRFPRLKLLDDFSVIYVEW